VQRLLLSGGRHDDIVVLLQRQWRLLTQDRARAHHLHLRVAFRQRRNVIDRLDALAGGGRRAAAQRGS
jgi:hypothetical protein